VAHITPSTVLTITYHQAER